MSLNLIAQIVGVLVTVSSVIGMQFKDMKWVLCGQLVSNLLLSLNLALLGALSGAGVCITATIQTVIVFCLKFKNKKFPAELSIIFAAAYTACSMVTYKNVIDILPCVAALVYAMSVIQDKSFICRVYIFINSVMWLVYDFSIGAYTTTITYFVLIASLIVAFIRNDISEWKNVFGAKQKKANLQSTKK